MGEWRGPAGGLRPREGMDGEVGGRDLQGALRDHVGRWMGVGRGPAGGAERPRGEMENSMDVNSLAWRIPWMEEPDGLQFMGSQRVGHD